MNNNLMVELPSASECNGTLTFARMNVARSARSKTAERSHKEEVSAKCTQKG